MPSPRCGPWSSSGSDGSSPAWPAARWWRKVAEVLISRDDHVYPKPLGAIAVYMMTARMWTRSAAQYRATLILMTVNSVVFSGLELGTVLLLFTNTKSLA